MGGSTTQASDTKCHLCLRSLRQNILFLQACHSNPNPALATLGGAGEGYGERNADQKLLVKQLNLELPPNLHRASQQQHGSPGRSPAQCSGDLRTRRTVSAHFPRTLENWVHFAAATVGLLGCSIQVRCPPTLDPVRGSTPSVN